MKTLIQKSLFILFSLSAIAQAKPVCYQATGPAEQIVGASLGFTATLWIQDTTAIADELIIKSGTKTATLALWCRDMETRKCRVDAEERDLSVKQTGDEIEFTFPGKLRLKGDKNSEIGFSSAAVLGDRKLKLKKTDDKNCPATTLKVPEFAAPAEGPATRK